MSTRPAPTTSALGDSWIADRPRQSICEQDMKDLVAKVFAMGRRTVADNVDRRGAGILRERLRVHVGLRPPRHSIAQLIEIRDILTLIHERGIGRLQTRCAVRNGSFEPPQYCESRFRGRRLHSKNRSLNVN